MYIQLCDRCGRKTNNKAAFATPADRENGTLMINGVWFGETVVLCNNCLRDFEDFRYNHERFNSNFICECIED